MPFTPPPMYTSADFERWQPWICSAVFVGVVVVRGRTERVDVVRAVVRVAGPAAGFAGDRGVADAHDPRRPDARDRRRGRDAPPAPTPSPPIRTTSRRRRACVSWFPPGLRPAATAGNQQPHSARPRIKHSVRRCSFSAASASAAVDSAARPARSSGFGRPAEAEAEVPVVDLEPVARARRRCRARRAAPRRSASVSTATPGAKRTRPTTPPVGSIHSNGAWPRDPVAHDAEPGAHVVEDRRQDPRAVGEHPARRSPRRSSRRR